VTSFRLLFALLLAALFPLACYQPPPTAPPPTPINITNNNTNTNNGGLTPTNPSPSDICFSVQRVDVRVPTVLRVGDSQRLDATPFDVAGNARPSACNERDGAAWSAGPSSVCILNSTVGFNPVLSARSLGNCTVSACVGGVCSGSQIVQVLP
jgi:hypothetical protein